ncbi:MAG: hypothetical protein WAN11_06890 [Syntrophobacteraceae bacterium]
MAELAKRQLRGKVPRLRIPFDEHALTTIDSLQAILFTTLTI